MISKLICKAKRNPTFMDELKSKEDEKALKKTEAIEQIQEMLV